MDCQNPAACQEHCLGGDEDQDAPDEFLPMRMNYDDELPVANLPAYSAGGKSGPISLNFGNKSAIPKTFSLPWADLDGNQRPNTLLSPRKEVASREPSQPSGDWRRRRGDEVFHATEKEGSLLPFASNFANPNAPKFANLPMPKFVTGIPVKAYQYEHDPYDPIDVALYSQLQKLDEEASMTLGLRRVEPGRYEIDGRSCRVYMGRSRDSQFMVHEDEVGGPSMADMALSAYVRLVANVAVSLQRPGFMPTLTFLDKGTQLHDNVEGEDRYAAMRMACTQAHLRQQEVEFRTVSDWHPGGR
mmetsp:Transcript_54365/g.94539  ORF Transcript_54365/g.94539 Transcript_54365/m.94539 type:complete len:301 (-) Transcript_54365:45-947(-)